MTITVVCALCRRFAEVPGIPDTEAKVFQTALALGWAVEGRKCYCPGCAPKR